MLKPCSETCRFFLCYHSYRVGVHFVSIENLLCWSIDCCGHFICWLLRSYQYYSSTVIEFVPIDLSKWVSWDLLSKSSSNIDFEEVQIWKTWRFLLVKDLHHAGKSLCSNRYGLNLNWQSVTQNQEYGPAEYALHTRCGLLGEDINKILKQCSICARQKQRALETLLANHTPCSAQWLPAVCAGSPLESTITLQNFSVCCSSRGTVFQSNTIHTLNW